MIKLYGRGQSRSFRCLWALEESGLPYEYIDVSIGSPKPGGTRTPEYLKLNFQGKVPTLVDGDLILTESAAIVNYIARRAPVGLVMPQDSRERALYDELCYFVMTDFEQPLWTTGKHKFALPKEQRVASVLPTAAWEFQKSLKALQHYFSCREGDQESNRRYAVASTFTGADILIAQTLNWGKQFGMELPENLEAYRQRMYDRPGCHRALDVIEVESSESAVRV